MEYIKYIGLGIFALGMLYLLSILVSKTLHWICKYLVIRFDMRTDIYGTLYSELDSHQKSCVDFIKVITDHLVISIMILVVLMFGVFIVGCVGYGISRGLGV